MPVDFWAMGALVSRPTKPRRIVQNQLCVVGRKERRRTGRDFYIQGELNGFSNLYYGADGRVVQGALETDNEYR